MSSNAKVESLKNLFSFYSAASSNGDQITTTYLLGGIGKLLSELGQTDTAEFIKEMEAFGKEELIQFINIMLILRKQEKLAIQQSDLHYPPGVRSMHFDTSVFRSPQMNEQVLGRGSRATNAVDLKLVEMRQRIQDFITRGNIRPGLVATSEVDQIFAGSATDDSASGADADFAIDGLLKSRFRAFTFTFYSDADLLEIARKFLQIEQKDIEQYMQPLREMVQCLLAIRKDSRWNSESSAE